MRFSINSSRTFLLFSVFFLIIISFLILPDEARIIQVIGLLATGMSLALNMESFYEKHKDDTSVPAKREPTTASPSTMFNISGNSGTKSGMTPSPQSPPNQPKEAFTVGPYVTRAIQEEVVRAQYPTLYPRLRPADPSAASLEDELRYNKTDVSLIDDTNMSTAKAIMDRLQAKPRSSTDPDLQIMTSTSNYVRSRHQPKVDNEVLRHARWRGNPVKLMDATQRGRNPDTMRKVFNNELNVSENRLWWGREDLNDDVESLFARMSETTAGATPV